jgi:uncharacterized protein HemX
MENETNTTITSDKKTGGFGGMVGAIIIIIILIIGGWYFIGNRIQEQNRIGKVLDVSTGTSTEVSDIQTDLNNLDLNSLDQ